MYNNEKKDDFQNFHDQWCEDWSEVWHEVWYNEASLDVKQTPKERYKKVHPSVNATLGDLEVDDVNNHHNINKVSEYKEENISNKDSQSKSNFLDYVDELESVLNPQTDLTESSQVHYDGVDSSLDVVVSMD